jgi:hypothetical protein
MAMVMWDVERNATLANLEREGRSKREMRDVKRRKSGA